MGKLLHVSDFHITKDKKQSRERLQSLANYLNESQINIDILVFSGDLVDAKRIVDITRHSFIKEHLDLDLNKNDIIGYEKFFVSADAEKFVNNGKIFYEVKNLPEIINLG